MSARSNDASWSAMVVRITSHPVHCLCISTHTGQVLLNPCYTGSNCQQNNLLFIETFVEHSPTKRNKQPATLFKRKLNERTETEFYICVTTDMVTTLLPLELLIKKRELLFRLFYSHVKRVRFVVYLGITRSIHESPSTTSIRLDFNFKLDKMIVESFVCIWSYLTFNLLKSLKFLHFNWCFSIILNSVLLRTTTTERGREREGERERGGKMGESYFAF